MTSTNDGKARRKRWSPKTTYTPLGTGPVLVLPTEKTVRENFGDVLTFDTSGACQAMVKAMSVTGSAVTVLDGMYLLSPPHDEIAFDHEMDPHRGSGPKSTKMYINRPVASVLLHMMENSRYYGLASLLRDIPIRTTDVGRIYANSKNKYNLKKPVRVGAGFYIEEEALPDEQELILRAIAWVKRAQIMFLRATNWHTMQQPGSPVTDKKVPSEGDIPYPLWVGAHLPAVMPHLFLGHPESLLNIARRPTYQASNRVDVDLENDRDKVFFYELIMYLKVLGTSRRGTLTAELDAASASARYMLDHRYGIQGAQYLTPTVERDLARYFGVPGLVDIDFLLSIASSVEKILPLSVRILPLSVRSQKIHLWAARNVTYGTRENNGLLHLLSAGSAQLSRWSDPRNK